jgi:drug/metabolite transporter (DMT)-like permease
MSEVESSELIQSKEHQRGTAAAFSVAVIWGLSFVAASVALKTLSPVTLATVRFIIASIIFLPFILGDLIKGKLPLRNDLKDMALLGVLSISLYFWLQYTGVKYTGPGVSAILVVGFIPILTGLFSSVVLKEEFTKQKKMGTILGFLGVSLITIPGLIIGNVGMGFYFGVACLLGNAVCWSIYSTYSRRLMQRQYRPATVTSYVTIFGALVLLPLSLTSDWGMVSRLDTSQWLSILYLASICSGGGYFLWNFALARIEAVRAAVWLYLEPVAAFIGEAILFLSMPDSLTLIGGFSIMAGALLTSSSKK